MKITHMVLGGLLIATVACSPLGATSDNIPNKGAHFRSPVPHGQVTPIKTGRTMTDSFVTLELRGSRPARLVSVTSYGGEGTLLYLGAFVAGPERNLVNDVQFATFPPSEKALGVKPQPAEGALVLPAARTRAKQGWQLLVGYQFIGKKMAARTRLVIQYTIDGLPYSQEFPSTLVACPRGTDQTVCGDYGRRISEVS